MAKIIGSEQTIELMVNCKTYPAVSKKYIETVCTGGVQANGDFVRLYPIPFRFLEDDEQYGRWDVIRVKVYRDTKDKRPESWHLQPGTKIEVVKTVSTDKQRWEWMQPTVHDSTEAMTEAGLTNGCVEIEPIEFYWKPDEKEWSSSQLQTMNQGQLFISEDDLKSLADRVPWQYRLKYREKNSGREGDAKILAWSLYQGFRRRLRTMDEAAALEVTATKVKSSIFNPEKKVFAIFGTHSRSGHWMISALYHVPMTTIRKQGSRLL